MLSLARRFLKDPLISFKLVILIIAYFSVVIQINMRAGRSAISLSLSPLAIFTECPILFLCSWLWVEDP